jgi:hypothetical protein
VAEFEPSLLAPEAARESKEIVCVF